MTVFNYETNQTVFNSVSYSWTPETAMQLFLENKEPMKVLLATERTKGQYVGLLPAAF